MEDLQERKIKKFTEFGMRNLESESRNHPKNPQWNLEFGIQGRKKREENSLWNLEFRVQQKVGITRRIRNGIWTSEFKEGRKEKKAPYGI